MVSFCLNFSEVWSICAPESRFGRRFGVKFDVLVPKGTYNFRDVVFFVRFWTVAEIDCNF